MSLLNAFTKVLSTKDELIVELCRQLESKTIEVEDLRRELNRHKKDEFPVRKE